MNKNLKIGILIDRLNFGGVEKIAIEEATSLIKAGENVTLVVLRRKGIGENVFEDLVKNIPVVYLDDRLPAFLRFSFKFPVFHFFSFFHISYPFLIPMFIKKNEFNYFIVHGTYTAFTAIGIKKLRKINYSVFIWDPIGYILARVYSKKLLILLDISIKFAKYLDKKIIINADLVLTGGSAHDQYLTDLHSKIKIKRIPPSVHPLGKIPKEKENYILMVTAWKKGKNPEYVFKIIDKIPKIKIKMVGKWIDSNYKKEFLKKIKTQKYTSNIEIVGEVTEKQLSMYYAKARVLLQTNDDKGFGMPALEAAGHGTTFVIPKDQGVCDLFADKKDGFYTTEKDTDTIVKYLTLLINDKVKYADMGKSAWQKVISNYSWEKHAHELLKVILRFSS